MLSLIKLYFLIAKFLSLQSEHKKKGELEILVQLIHCPCLDILIEPSNGNVVGLCHQISSYYQLLLICLHTHIRQSIFFNRKFAGPFF
jgi:hypothetical protein